jgi:hypothetical protein
MAYLFSYAGKPWRTEELANKICTEFYTNTPEGLIGNEDCGQMSAWYVLSALGFYPVCPGNGQYVFGSPLFDEAVIHLENGNDFTIRAPRKSQKEFYVQSVRWRQSPYSKTYIEHADLMRGGFLDFKMGAIPNKARGQAATDLPRSSIKQETIVPVPYFDMTSNKFRTNTLIKLKSIEAGVEIFYRVRRPNIMSVFQRYKKPFEIDENTQVDAYVVKKGKQSKTVTQDFFRFPDDKNIEVLSKVHPMYTAGGPDALIDGITGTTNWRTGEWQSYFDNDFYSIVDLKQSRPVTYVAYTFYRM